jgi:glycosyltransferase involved in cell wall biosynthesis
MSSPVNRKRKLVFLWTYTNWGGAQVYFFAIMKLAREEWDVLVLIPKESKPDLIAFLDELGVKYEFLKYAFDPGVESTLKGKVKRQMGRIRSEIEMFKALRRFEVGNSVFHIEIAPWQSWILLVLLSVRKAKVFATLHNFRPNPPQWRRLVWKLRFQVVSRLPGFQIFASNKDTKDSLKEWVTQEFWEDIKVTYTSVDPEQIAKASSEQFERKAERELLGITEDMFVVLAVGQFIDRKGRWTFLEAAAKVRKETAEVGFVWVMPNEIVNKDRNRIRDFGLGDAFVPVLSKSIGSDRISILRFFRIADAFALPSFVEGLPIALLEAMAMGIPSISTNVYAIPEAVIDRETGILIEAGDSDALSGAITLLKGDSQLRQKLARQGSKYVLEHFDEREAAAVCIDAYRKALGVK